MDRNTTGYYYCITVGMELVIHGSQIKNMREGYIEADEVYQVSAETGKLGQRMLKLGIHSNVALNFSFLSELDSESELLKMVKEFEIRRNANVILEGSA